MRKSSSVYFLKHLRAISACTALALLTTGCHFDSNVDMDAFRESSLDTDLDVIYDGIPVFAAPLTLEDVYEVASTRNLNILVKRLEYDIQTELVTLLL